MLKLLQIYLKHNFEKMEMPSMLGYEFYYKYSESNDSIVVVKVGYEVGYSTTINTVRTEPVVRTILGYEKELLLIEEIDLEYQKIITSSKFYIDE